MSILIKGMEMPENCESCTIAHLADCELWIKAGYRQRHKDCPLIEVPPHGRLIDADAVIDAVNRAVTKEAARWSIMEQPTIIEAEEGEEE